MVLRTGHPFKHSAHIVSQCSQANFFLNDFYFLFLIMVPKAKGSIFIYEALQLIEERMSVSGMLTPTKI